MPLRDDELQQGALAQVAKRVAGAAEQLEQGVARATRGQSSGQGGWLGGLMQREVERWKQRMSLVIVHQQLSQTALHTLGLFHSYETMEMGEFLTHLEALRLQIKGIAPLEQAVKPLVQAMKSAPSPGELESLRHDFMQRWQHYLDEDVLAEQLQWLDQAREEQLQQLYRRMQATEQLSQLVPPGDAEQAGRLWDMADASLSQQEMHELDALARWLARQPELQQIAAELGRRADEERRRKLLQQGNSPRPQPDPAPEEVAGIRFGRDLERLLTTSAVMLSVDELEYLFYKQLAEGQLLSYQLEGLQWQKTPAPQATPAARAPQDLVAGGPFVVCVDTSGSMAGFPERCAKALTLALMQQAVAQNRHCHVLIFSTQVVGFELCGAEGLSQAKAFLSYRFLGGTDLNRCLSQAIARLQQQAYHNADIVVISDFIAPRCGLEIQQQLPQLAAAGNRLHAVALSAQGNPSLLALFDSVWQRSGGVYGRLLRRQR